MCLTLVAVLIAYPFLGSESLYLLLAGITGPIFGLTYGIAGKKVQVLKESFSNEDGEMQESLIVIGKIQSPGIVILKESKLRLIPIVGKEVALDTQTIKFVRMVSYFNGKSLIWKQWLVLSTQPVLGFALPEPVANQWFTRLNSD